MISVYAAFFRLLRDTGLTAPEVFDILNDAIERERLRLWRDGTPVSPSHFRRHMSIGFYHGVVRVVPKAAAWSRNPVFELDEGQIRRLIAKLAKPCGNRSRAAGTNIH